MRMNLISITVEKSMTTRFFSDDLDGVGTGGYTHTDGSTQSIVTLDDEELGERAAEHLNQFFGSDFSKPPLDYVERLPESRNLSNIEVLLTDFLLWSTGGEDKNFETSYEFLCESAQNYVKHIDEMWADTDLRVNFESPDPRQTGSFEGCPPKIKEQSND